jgi:hypothetical protein
MKEVQDALRDHGRRSGAGCAWERKVGMKEVQRCSRTSVGGVVAGCAWERKVGMKEVQEALQDHAPDSSHSLGDRRRSPPMNYPAKPAPVSHKTCSIRIR